MSGNVCSYWLEVVCKRNKQYEICMPRWLVRRIQPVKLEYSAKDLLYHYHGAVYSILRKFDNQGLAELTVRHGFPEDAWKWILKQGSKHG